MIGEEFMNQLTDFDRWDEIFTEEEISRIKDWYESHSLDNMIIIRLLFENLNESIFPYYVWMIFEMGEDNMIENLNILFPETEEALIATPELIESMEYLALDDRAFKLEHVQTISDDC